MPERLVPTYFERVGSAAEPRTESVPDAVMPLLVALIVVKPARSGVTLPLASTVAMLVSVTVHVSAAPATGAPDWSVAVAATAVACATDAVVTAGSERAVT